MMRVFLTIAISFLASPMFAQEIDLELGGDVSSLLNIPAPRGNTPARGAARGGPGTPEPSRGGVPNTPPVDRLVRLREVLAGANAPLSKEQETALTALVNSEIPVMRQTLQKRIGDIQRAGVGAAAPTPAANLPSMDELAPEIIRLNDQLLGKIAVATLLSPEQQTLLKKLYKEQVKSRGGFDAIKLTLENAGVPFSAEQIAQIQPLFDEQNHAKLQLLKESQPPDKAKIDQLQRETLAKVIKLLTPTQRSAFVGK